MNSKEFTKPIFIFFLCIPYGLSNGYVTIVLPYVLSQNGFSVAQVASIVAFGFSANIWRFLLGPIVDVSLTLKKWYIIGNIISISSLIFLSSIYFEINNQAIILVFVFVSQLASTFTLLPVNGFMAYQILENQKGRTSSMYQAGSLFGIGIGGGGGLWVTTHFSNLISGVLLGLVSISCVMVLFWIKDIQQKKKTTLIKALIGLGEDMLSIIKLPIFILIIFLFLLPIGTGSLSNLWSAIAVDWKTNSDTVALVTGVLSGIVSAFGCIVGGYIIDNYGNWVAYIANGLLCAIFTFIMAILPMQCYVFVLGVLMYNFSIGMIYAPFTSIILYVSGKKNVATKFSLLASLGNLPVTYMTAFNGWIHDKYNSTIMLMVEASIGVFFILIFFILLKIMMIRKLVPSSIE